MLIPEQSGEILGRAWETGRAWYGEEMAASFALAACIRRV
jgi:hypothetical protein